jgi:hypothetical protein
MTRLSKVRTLTLATVIMALVPSVVFGETRWAGGLYLTAENPQGDFEDQLDRNAYGISGQFFYSPQRSPLALGVELSFMSRGDETHREPFPTTLPDVWVDVVTSDRLLQGLLILRGQTPKGQIRLYGDALVGFNYLDTWTHVTGDVEVEHFINEVRNDDVVMAYGLGGGVLISMYESKPPKQESLQVLLDGGLRYLLGGKAEYFRNGSVRYFDEADLYYYDYDDRLESETNMIMMHAGVLIRF